MIQVDHFRNSQEILYFIFFVKMENKKLRHFYDEMMRLGIRFQYKNILNAI